MNILFLDCCVRGGDSRTLSLCKVFLAELCRRHPEADVRTVALYETAIGAMGREELDERDRLIGEKRFSDPVFDYAREFAAADYVLVGAPYWDLSFPACLKNYIERISVNGIAFTYVETGSLGLCRAKELMYISTAGGFVPGGRHAGEEYMKQICDFYGVGKFKSYCLEGLDICGTDVKGKMEKASAEVAALAAGRD